MDQEDMSDKARKPVTVLEGDGYYFDRLLLRKSSIGHSSRVYYRDAEGVPFQWEKQPGTPMNPRESEVIPPLTPPPAVQSLGLPRPCVVDQIKDSKSNRWRIWFWKRSSKKRQCNKEKFEMSSDKFESVRSNSGSEFIANSLDSFSTSSSASLSNHDRALQSTTGIQKDSLDGQSFVCSPWNLSAILQNEGKTNTCKAVSVPQGDGFILSKIVPRNSSIGQSSRMYYRSTKEEGVPFKWEMQPGKSKDPLQDEVIPPPSPPPAMQNQGLRRPCIHQPKDSITTSRVWFWKTSNYKDQQNKKVHNTISYKSESIWSSSTDRESEVTLQNSSFSTSSSSSSRGSFSWLSRSWRDLWDRHFCCSPWSIRDSHVGVRRRA